VAAVGIRLSLSELGGRRSRQLPDSVVLVAVAAGVQSCRPQLSALSQLLRNAAVQSPDLHPRAGGGDF